MKAEQRAELEKLARELDRLAECEGGVRGGSPNAAMTMTCSAIGIRDLLATIARLEAEAVKDGEALQYYAEMTNGGGIARARLSSRAKDQSQ